MEMERISVAEAARRLGISPRATRFRIERDELRAEKENGVWRVIWPPDSAEVRDAEVKPANRLVQKAGLRKSRKSLPAGEGNRQDSASPSSSVSVPAPRHTKELTSLAAFRILRGVFERVPDIPESLRHKQCLHGALREVTRGYYQWRRDAKLHCYNEARNWVADAMLELILHPLPDSHLTAKLVRELEHDALSALVGLSRRFERKEKRGDDGAG